MAVGDDSFISDEEEDYCPLCVEEMDISDKNFKPCPCGYQICQFCYNNIRQNPELNGRCPGCRRLYDDESVEYKTISPEEYKLQQLKKERREREKKQREKEKKETEMANKKHLAGLRVVQKNLVYVTGLNPPCNPDDVHSVLRSDKYFGQYGKIQKIVINRKTPNPLSVHHHHQNPGLVVYVTFARKEDALRCINELDGSLCDGRVLRAAHGTTKYCSSYLRGHPCPNPNCMFLHEPGEEADSYTRKDLSTQQGIKMSMMGMSNNKTGQANSSNTNNAFSSNGGARSTTNEEQVGENDNESQASTQPNTSAPSSSSNNGPVLPSTAQWAKMADTSNSSSPVTNNSPALANAAAFPTLGEIFRDQKHQKKDSKQKIRSGKNKDSNSLLPDDIDVDDENVINFMDQTSELLKSMSQAKEKLNVHFRDLSAETGGVVLPLFNFNPKRTYVNKSVIEDEKILAKQVIERFVWRPIKNYHLAYQNHPIAQQQALLQQQAQLQQRQKQTPNVQVAQLQQLHLEQQKRLLEQQSSQNGGGSAVNNTNAGTNPSTPGVSSATLQQQQQLLLLQQLQQQQKQLQILQSLQQNIQQPPAAAQNQAQAHLNMLRLQELSGQTSTPPPPGLLNNSAKNTGNQASGSQPSSTSQVPYQSLSSNQSTSSQLLTQLMSGKR